MQHFYGKDNSIGNKRNVKLFRKELQPWTTKHHYPFSFATEASVNLAQGQELVNLWCFAILMLSFYELTPQVQATP